MSERENDIEFDFFEEPDTGDGRGAPPTARSRPPVRPPTGLTPLLRLIGLISFAILIVLLLVLWVNGCREDKRKDAYRNTSSTSATTRASRRSSGASSTRSSRRAARKSPTWRASSPASRASRT